MVPVATAHGSSSKLCKQLVYVIEAEGAYIYFHFIKILHRYRAVGHIHSKALFWLECNSTREKREAITFSVFHLYIQTPPMLHFIATRISVFNPTFIAASYRDWGDNN